MLPPRSCLPSNIAVSPLPGKAVNALTSAGSIFCCRAYAITARASGCSLFASKAAALRSSSAAVTSSVGTMSVTCGSPLVIVPVLSSATTFVLPVSSKEAAVLNKMPFFAPTPLPTMIATGVANPSAQGQLMTSTEIALASA